MKELVDHVDELEGGDDGEVDEFIVEGEVVVVGEVEERGVVCRDGGADGVEGGERFVLKTSG